MIEAKRARPGSDLLTRLVSAPDGDDGLTAEEVGTLALLLFAAGFETTTNLIGNATVGLLAQPEQMDVLRSRPELFATLPDELLRYDGTVQITARLAAEPVELDGVVIAAGDPVFPLLGAANRDPARFVDPDRLDVTRSDVRPLTFGGGLHFCLGAALARVETEIVFRKLLERFATIELAGEAPFRDRLTLRGPAQVPVTVVEAARHGGAAVPGTSLGGVADGPVAGPPPVRRAPSIAHRRDDTGAMAARPLGGADESGWRAEFRARLEARPPASAGELASVAALLSRVPLFGGCTVDELEDVAATAYPLAFDAGEMLCAEGAASPECYVIAEGTASVVIDGTQVATVGADDVVGERGPLLDAPRTATVTALSHMITYSISRDRLRRLMQESPAALAGMDAALRRRFGDSEVLSGVVAEH